MASATEGEAEVEVAVEVRQEAEVETEVGEEDEVGEVEWEQKAARKSSSYVASSEQHA